MVNRRIAVAMSGGVDSSVAAALLVNKGHEVFGLTMELTGKESRCCSQNDIQDAREVARDLGIPHYVISLREAFQKHVINYFVREYVRGRTPNPCAVCNPVIKFGILLEKALELGADAFATGHYALVKYDSENKRYVLKRARERGKDQSYFLARLSQKALRRTLFPVGSFSKSKIREKAARLQLQISEKTESMDTCFLPDTELIEFLEMQADRSFESGPVMNDHGKTIGRHRGIAGYTIGQRKGLGVAAGFPVYVTQIDPDSNTLVVGPAEKLYHRNLIASDPNWIAIRKAAEPIRARVRIRYKHRPAWAWVEQTRGEQVKIQFDSPQRAITPGQLAVFYDGDAVIGSAWIDSII